MKNVDLEKKRELYILIPTVFYIILTYHYELNWIIHQREG